MPTHNVDNDRVMNDTTLPIQKSEDHGGGPLEEASPVSPQQRQLRSKKSRFGMAEWTRLLRLSKDLAQRQGQPIRKIRWEEIQQHNSQYDGWIVLRGKVYNLSPYLPYHPGGEAILEKVLGKDGTKLFDHYHRWVNEDSLIGKLLIGYVDEAKSRRRTEKEQEEIRDGLGMPAPRPEKQNVVAIPSPFMTSLDESPYDDTDEIWEKDKTTS